MGASVIAAVDAAPAFELSEHVPNFVALVGERGIMGNGHFTICLRRDAWCDAALLQNGAEPVGIIAPVGEQCFGFREGVDH